MIQNSPTRLKIKVCGMRDTENIMAVAQSGTDLMGFIFYPQSPRYVGTHFDSIVGHWVQNSVKTVGVFVNESLETVIHTVRRYQLNYVQLHGDESPDYCQRLKEENVLIIKAFGLNDSFDFAQLEAYEAHVSCFLFDTKSEKRGGTGQQFDWEVLQNYKLKTPFWLSGGIGPNHAEAINNFAHPKWIGVDINSGFEDAPAQKNVEKLRNFIQAIENKNIQA